MAKTFDNISEASATNYLFLVAQRTLALQNEPPTPPPLNALGLPCHAVCLLWARLYPKKATDHKYLSAYLSILATWGVPTAKKAAEQAKAKTAAEQANAKANKATEQAEAKKAEAAGAEAEAEAEAEAAGDALKAAAEAEVARKMQLATAAVAANEADDDALKAAEGAAAVEGRAASSHQQQQDTGEIEAATAKETTNKAHSPDYDAPLAKQVTEYILDNQDDAAQEERWRTTMKRETMKRFREQREASDKQREHVQKIETEMQAFQKALQLKMDENMKALQLKMDENMDQLTKLIKK